MGISKWNAGIIRPVPVAPAGPFENGAAPGVWTLDQQAYWQKQALWPVAGNVVPYIEDMFSTWLYKGNDATQTVTNGVDLAGKGGLVWIKNRGASANHRLYSTGLTSNTYNLVSNTTDAQADTGEPLAFASNGWSITGSGNVSNNVAFSYTSWTFRKQPKFFDVVTYTGNGVAGRTVAHNLGSTPGSMIIKRTDGVTNWHVYHRSLGAAGEIYLNLTSAVSNNPLIFNNTSPTSTEFTLGDGNGVNGNGFTYVAYLFAHNAGGFGLTGTDNVVSCGSFTTDGTGAAGNITLGYEAQWLLIKRSDGVGSWNIIDVMRGSSLTSYRYLQPNASTAESNSTSLGQGIFPTATGFFVGTNFPAASATYIYMAIRRPMKVPTLGTSVFSVDTTTADSAITSTLKQTDMGWFKDRTTVANWFVADRLRGFTNAYYTPTLYTNATDAEVTPTTGDTVTAFGPTTTGVNNGVIYAGGAGVAGNYPLLYSFKRAPGFFDEVCYTGTGSATTQAHNLTVTPEFLIVKRRSTAADEWTVRAAGTTGELYLNRTNAQDSSFFYLGAPTSTTFSLLSGGTQINAASNTYVAYLFATAAGVSKVGSYTGTGALQTIACGFTTGARFVLIKRINAVGDWYVWDSARGITSGNDPYLLLNTTAAEITATNYVDTDTTGFKVTAAAPAALNAVGGTYIFLAIA